MKQVQDKIRLTAIRLIKKQAGLFGLPKVTLQADFYCVLPEGDYYLYEWAEEYVVYFEHLQQDDANICDFQVELPDNIEIEAVLVEDQLLKFTQVGKQLVFQVEVNKLRGKTQTLSVHTVLREKGIVLRFEQNQYERFLGDYQQMPELEFKAAQHYEVAAREILRLSGVANYVHHNELGYFLLAGFETHDRFHKDYPAHWHFIFRWPYRIGSQAPHIYLDEQGRNIYNKMWIDCIPKVNAIYEVDEWCPLLDNRGNEVIAFKINADGGITFTQDHVMFFEMTPYQENKGVQIKINDTVVRMISLSNDTKKGQLEIVAQQVERIQYNPLTGVVEKYEIAGEAH